MWQTPELSLHWPPRTGGVLQVPLSGFLISLRPAERPRTEHPGYGLISLEGGDLCVGPGAFWQGKSALRRAGTVSSQHVVLIRLEEHMTRRGFLGH